MVQLILGLVFHWLSIFVKMVPGLFFVRSSFSRLTTFKPLVCWLAPHLLNLASRVHQKRVQSLHVIQGLANLIIPKSAAALDCPLNILLVTQGRPKGHQKSCIAKY
jgi:hypothetical protein